MKQCTFQFLAYTTPLEFHIEQKFGLELYKEKNNKNFVDKDIVIVPKYLILFRKTTLNTFLDWAYWDIFL